MGFSGMSIADNFDHISDAGFLLGLLLAVAAGRLDAARSAVTPSTPQIAETLLDIHG
jgi:hypothetical protein